MWFGKKEELQRLNLETPKLPPSRPDPAKVEEVKRRAQQILESGRTPRALFVCGVDQGLLLFRYSQDQSPVLLLFSHPFAANDYLRSTATSGSVRQVSIDALPNLARSWLSMGIHSAAIDRCPRCTEFSLIDLNGLAKWTVEDFSKVWAHHRAARLTLGAVRVQSAMKHLAAGSHAAARADLEYVRDHFDCGIPYVHQVIAVIAGIQQDEPARLLAAERLKEFGPQFEGQHDFSPELLATAMVGLMANFGIALPESRNIR